MKNLKVKGKIIKISSIQTFDSGSGKLTFRIDTGEEWNNIVEFELFKKSEYLKHLESFSLHNKLNDVINVEYNIKTNHYTGNGKDAVYTTLSCWKVEKIDKEPQTQENENSDDLPF